MVLNIRAPAVHVGALVAGQGGQQLLAQRPEEPFDSGLVGRGVGPGRLDRDAQAGAHALQMLGQVDLAVVKHHGLGRHAGQAGVVGAGGQAAGVDHHRRRHAEVGRDAAAGQGPGPRGDRLVEHQAGVDGLGGHWRETDRRDTPAVEVEGNGQLQADPSQRHRLHGEHVEAGGVEEEVLAWAGGAQSPVDAGGAISDRALGLGAARERVGPPRELANDPPGSLGRRPRDIVAEAGFDAFKQELTCRPAGVHVLVENCGAGVEPSLIDTTEGIVGPLGAAVNQRRRSTVAQLLSPSPDGARTDAQLRRLGPVAIHQRTGGVVFRSGLTSLGGGWVAGAKPADGFTDMGQPIPQLGEPGRIQVGHDAPGTLRRLRLGHQQPCRRVGEQLADVDLNQRTL